MLEPELHLGRDVLVPDLTGWRRERMPALPETAYFELPPDWVCEVLSPATARLDRIDKLPICAPRDVGHAWLVDPDLRTLEYSPCAKAIGGWSAIPKTPTKFARRPPKR